MLALRSSRPLDLVSSGLVSLMLGGCPSSAPQAPPPPRAASAETPTEASEPRAREAAQAREPRARDAAETPPEVAHGRITEGPLPLLEMLGAAPPEVEARLGEPFGKGMMRDTCVRFVPKRTWFRCSHAWQRYQDATGTFTGVQVTYEDGKATAIALEGVPGTGPFDPRQALRAVGVELPGEPAESSPATDTQLWSWFNSAARLRVHGREYRVEVSSVGGTWDTSKVELILNDALTPEERQRIIE